MISEVHRLRALEIAAKRSHAELPAWAASIGKETEEGHEYIVALCRVAPALFKVVEAASVVVRRSEPWVSGLPEEWEAELALALANLLVDTRSSLNEPTITADEFEQAYADRSGLSVNQLRQNGRLVVRCYCDYEDCPGWASVGKENAEDYEPGAIYGPPGESSS